MEASSSTARICLVCQREYAKYICPRCNTPYCNLKCYKAHSESCTESFYRESACDELRGQHASPEQRQKMMEALERDHQAEAASLEQLQAGLEELDLDNLSIEQLTASQRRDFERAIVDGRLSSALTAWEPWWRRGSKAEGEQAEGMALPADLPPIESLLNGRPASDSLSFHLVQIIYSYAYCMRQFNGNWTDDPLGAAAVTLQLSDVLRNAAAPESVGEAFSSALAASHDPNVFVSGDFSNVIMDDVKAITKQVTFVYRTIAEMHQIHEQALQMAPKGKKQRRNVVHKLWFFLVWAGSVPRADLLRLHAQVASEVAALKSAQGVEQGLEFQMPNSG